MPRLTFAGLWDRRPRRPRAPRQPAPVLPTGAPEHRAEALLLRHLTPHQRKTYLRHGWFDVRGRDGSLWKIDRNGGSQNVSRTTRNGTQVYCTDLEDAPRADTLLVQKLCIEATRGRGLPRRHGATLCDEGLFYTTRGRRWRSAVGTSPPDPIALNQAALEHRQLGQFEEAERHLRDAIEIEDSQVAADSPKRPHRRNNLALVLLRAGKLVEARRVTAEAWRLKAGQHDVTSGRILFVRIALRFLRGDSDVGLYLGQLKTLLQRNALPCRGHIAPIWEIPDVITTLREKLRAGDAELLVHVAEVLNDHARLEVLEVLDAWSAALPIPLEAPWPDD